MFLQEEPSNEMEIGSERVTPSKWSRFYDVRNQEGFRTLMLRQNSKGEWMVLFQLYREEKKIEKIFSILF